MSRYTYRVASELVGKPGSWYDDGETFGSLAEARAYLRFLREEWPEQTHRIECRAEVWEPIP